MSDSKTRQLERAAATGDTQAQDRLAQMKQRQGQGRHADKVGEWVAIFGFRDHFRGRLIRVEELANSRAIGYFHPFYWVRDMETGEGLKRNSSEEHPVDLYLDVQLMELQAEDWPTT